MLPSATMNKRAHICNARRFGRWVGHGWRDYVRREWCLGLDPSFACT
ncbi:DUF3742 family protein [Acerihabitans arboris]